MPSPQTPRNERKYVLTAFDARIVAQRLGTVMTPDPHADAGGGYRVTSVYFDDVYLRAYRQKIAGYPDRLKFRVRAYNGDWGHATLEAKVKHGGRIAKESAPLSEDECAKLLGGDYGWLLGRDEPAAREFFKQSRVWAGLKPVVAADYYRRAFYAPGGVRVTLDEGLRGAKPVCIGAEPGGDVFGGARAAVGGGIFGGTKQSGGVFGGANPIRALCWRDALGNRTILEVKCGGFFPAYIRDLFSGFGMRGEAVSKYVLCMEKTYGL
uniref:VTC domain-containing protein n=1 Tax=uncultured bacterium contig00040 TaxID=1181528 RepID=A0A806K0H6_9BACT|nr:hypothetical protein [uncultured bacterium contig00040]